MQTASSSIQVPANKGKGKAYQWLVEHADYPHDEWCLIWPFTRDKHGRGNLGYNGKGYWAHRFMCELAHGPAPEGKPHAAHNCGKGHEGCVNPRHLDWKSVSENMQDRWDAVLVRHPNGTARRLQKNQAREIFAAKGLRTQGELAAQYGISESSVSNIWCGRTYKLVCKVPYWTPEQDQQLRDGIKQKLNFTQIAALIGRPKASIWQRAYRLGLKSGYQRTKLKPIAPALAPANYDRT